MKDEYTFTLTLDDGTLVTQTVPASSVVMKTEWMAKDMGLGRTQFNHYLDPVKGELNIGSINYKLWRISTDQLGRTRWATDVSSSTNPALREQLAAIGREQRAANGRRSARDAGGRWDGLPDSVAGTLTTGNKR